jgi:hypothetical protein
MNYRNTILGRLRTTLLFANTALGPYSPCIAAQDLALNHACTCVLNCEVEHHGCAFLVFSLDRIYITCGRAGSSAFPQYDRCWIGR